MKTILNVLFLFIIASEGYSQVVSGTNKLYVEASGNNNIGIEQKIYELSMIWKEVSYNYDNFDLCSNLNFDSLYIEYIPIVMNTNTDYEFIKSLWSFMGNLNNSHNNVLSFKIYGEMGNFVIPIKTIYKDNKIFVDNFMISDTGVFRVGDEIIEINNMPALDFFVTHCVPYVTTANNNDKIHFSMFNFYSGRCHIYPLNSFVKFKLKNNNMLREVEYKVVQKKSNGDSRKYFLNDFTVYRNNSMVCIDSISKTGYINIPDCSQETSDYFREQTKLLNNCDTLIVDLSNNAGGQSVYNNVIYEYLIQKDSVESFYCSSREHVPVRKGQGCDYCKPDVINDTINDYWCSMCKGTYYGEKTKMNFFGKMPIDKSYNFKGKIYVLLGRDCGSAGENLVTMLTQDEKITFLGSKTAGCTGRPYTFTLPSGIEVMINTLKTFDFTGKDVSSGIEPEYYVDFYDCYHTTDPQQLLDCIKRKIKMAVR